MVFMFVVFVYLFGFFALAAGLEACLLRLQSFRSTQRRDFPTLCGLIDRAFPVLHLDELFVEDEPLESVSIRPAEVRSAPALRAAKRRSVCKVNLTDRAA